MENRKVFLKTAFSYADKSILSEQVQELFASMVETPAKSVEYVSDIIDKAMTGKIDLNGEFNLGGYCHTIKFREKMTANKKSKKEKFINEDTSDFENTHRQGGISLYELVNLDNEITKLDDDSEVSYAVSTIKRLQKDFLINEGINLKVLLKRALDGVPQAVSSLRDVCTEFELVGEHIRVILGSGRDFTSLGLC